MEEKFGLYKFGRREHVLALAERGQLYMTPVSYYSNEGLSKGAFDDGELEVRQTLPKGQTTYDVFSKEGKFKGSFKPLAEGPLIAGQSPNAYVFCLSYDYNKALYEEFEADTCLIIEDADVFINQVCMALMNKLKGWVVGAGTVTYRNEDDFFSLYPTNQDIYYNKPMKYAHQKEIRIVCTNSDYTDTFEPFVIDVGTIHHYTHITGIERPDHMISTQEYINAWVSPWPRERN